MKLIDDWKECWRWFSTWCFIIIGGLASLADASSVTWEFLPMEWKQVLLEGASTGAAFKIISVLSAIGVVGRLIKQKEKRPRKCK